MRWGGAAGVGWDVRGFGMSLLSKLGHSLSIALWPTLGSRKAKDSIALFSCFLLSSVCLSVCLFVWLFVCLLAALGRIKIYITYTNILKNVLK